SGRSYSLPSGTVISSPGLYHDTLRYVSGCDSLITHVTLTVEAPAIRNINAYFFTGQSYTLPWGNTVNIGGLYRDTARSIAGCDSVITIVDLRELTVQSNNVQAVVCAGESYTLPWGGTVNATGIYMDTIKSVTGADSVLNIVDLTVQPRTILTPDSSICQNALVTLRAGSALSYVWSPVAGLGNTTNAVTNWTATNSTLFRLTTTHTNPEGGTISCNDSVRITVQARNVQNLSRIICAGQSYTLPGGRVVNTTGLYADTLRYKATGCDSLITNLGLTVQGFTTRMVNASICGGQSYTLPSGKIVSATGQYTDTLRYTTGCDSVITTANLTRYDATTTTQSATICLGNSFILPTGRVITTTGAYRDTLRYTNGCDSAILILNLTVSDAIRQSSTQYICAGTSYRLPSGRSISATGVYNDTLRTAQMCDSLISSITLVVDASTNQALRPTICQGQTHTLPSGRVISTAGRYLDTLRNMRGCDSILYTIDLTVTPGRFSTQNVMLCAGQSFTRPSGRIATTAGSYVDTIASVLTGCDSIITTTLSYR
ncbi:MAG TPA: hypothetical protein VK907_13280, partial [Phnomibacter sp.]|nr:hypothetical protein [Phnomibacter sp.]